MAQAMMYRSNNTIVPSPPSVGTEQCTTCRADKRNCNQFTFKDDDNWCWERPVDITKNMAETGDDEPVKCHKKDKKAKKKKAKKDKKKTVPESAPEVPASVIPQEPASEETAPKDPSPLVTKEVRKVGFQLKRRRKPESSLLFCEDREEHDTKKCKVSEETAPKDPALLVTEEATATEVSRETGAAPAAKVSEETAPKDPSPLVTEEATATEVSRETDSASAPKVFEGPEENPDLAAAAIDEAASAIVLMANTAGAVPDCTTFTWKDETCLVKQSKCYAESRNSDQPPRPQKRKGICSKCDVEPLNKYERFCSNCSEKIRLAKKKALADTKAATKLEKDRIKAAKKKAKKAADEEKKPDCTNCGTRKVHRSNSILCKECLDRQTKAKAERKTEAAKNKAAKKRARGAKKKPTSSDDDDLSDAVASDNEQPAAKKPNDAKEPAKEPEDTPSEVDN